MKRLLLDKLKQWKESKSRKPLILKGVRQCVKRVWRTMLFGRCVF